MVLLTAVMLWNKRPELSRISGEIAMSANMTCYVVDETEKYPVFYEINKDGKILRFFRDTSEKGRIFCITWTEDGICYLKQESGTKNVDTYGIYLLEEASGKIRYRGRLELEAGSRLAEMGTEGEKMYAAVMEKARTKLSIYQWNRDEDKKIQPKLIKSLEAGEGEHFTDGACWKEKIYGLTESGTMISAEKETSGVTWLTGTRAGIFFEVYPERELCITGDTGTKKYQGQEQAVSADAMSQKAFWTIQKTSGDSCFLNLNQNKKDTRVTELHMAAADYLSMQKWAVLLTAGLGAVGWLVIFGIVRILAGKPPLWIKAVTAVLAVQVLAAGGAAAFHKEKGGELETLALLWGKREIERMEQEIPGFLDVKVLKQEENRARLSIPDFYEESIKISSMVIYAENEKGYIISAQDQAYGYEIGKLYGKNILDAAVRAADEGKAECAAAEGDSRYAAAVLPLGEKIAADTFLIVHAEYLPDTETFRQTYGVLLFALADSMLLGAVCVLLLHPVKRFAGIVNRIAEGKQEEIPDSHSRELGQAWHSVQVLLFQRERERHESDQKIRSCRRFVPEHFPELMEKNSLDEIVPGEVKKTEGGFLLIYLGDGTQTGRLMKLFEQEREQKAGVLFPEGSRLDGLRMVYENMPKAAVQDAIGVWKRINSAWDTDRALNPLFLLHAGSCMCGVAGTGRQVIPFAASAELDWLSEAAKQFRENGVRMAVTEEMRSCLKPEQEYRYVGCIRAGEREYRFYEVLEVFPEKEKQRRSRTKEKFEASIALFYQNDFYLARLGFSEVLKECPKDRLAVWYLFACERMFHGEPGAEQNHNLFADGTEKKS